MAENTQRTDEQNLANVKLSWKLKPVKKDITYGRSTESNTVGTLS